MKTCRFAELAVLCIFLKNKKCQKFAIFLEKIINNFYFSKPPIKTNPRGQGRRPFPSLGLSVFFAQDHASGPPCGVAFLGLHMGCPRGYPWPITGQRKSSPLAYPWPTPGPPLAYPWPTPGLPLAYPWPTPGLPLAYTWPTPGLHLAYTWPTHC